MARQVTNLAAKKLVVAALVGIVGGLIVMRPAGWLIGVLVGWDLAALVYLGLTWFAVGRMGPSDTARHALREDPTVAASDILLLLASVASIVGEGVVMISSKSADVGQGVSIAVALVSLVVSWALVHTVFMLRYARLYYGRPEGGVNFNQSEPPAYSDFAYLAYTIGMTYQVSDTAFTSRNLRATALRQALISYLFGAVILAGVVNLIAGLGS
jgi:uncharacterized membrane protein